MVELPENDSSDQDEYIYDEVDGEGEVLPIEIHAMLRAGQLSHQYAVRCEAHWCQDAKEYWHPDWQYLILA